MAMPQSVDEKVNSEFSWVRLPIWSNSISIWWISFCYW